MKPKTKLTLTIDKNSLLIYLLTVFTWAKLVFANTVFFDQSPSLSFYLFTLSTAFLIYSWTLFLRKGKVWAALIISFVSSFVIWADIVYFRFFGSLVKVEALFLAGQVNDVYDSVLSLVRPWDIFLFVDAIIVAIIFVRFRHKFIIKSSKHLYLFPLILTALSLTMIFGLFFIDARNGDLNTYINRNFDVNLLELRYGVFGAHGLNAYRFISDVRGSIDDAEKEEVIAWFSKNSYEQDKNVLTGLAEGEHVFLIQLESLQSFAFGMEFQGKEVTPNLNKLVKESAYFPNGEAQIGGGKTSDSDFATNTSIYPLSDSSVFVRFGRDDFTSLPKAMKKDGYNTNAYHAYKRDFWNRGVAFNSLGYDHFYAADEYEDGTQVIMGLNDESFYRQTLEKINTEEPSFNYLISLSSHYPFDMAEEFQLLDVPYREEYNYRTYHYLQAIHYADYALGIFLEGLKEKDIYDDSLVVVYGDHEANYKDASDDEVARTLGVSNVIGNEYKTIPFIYKLPNGQLANTYQDKVGQIDIMPTILNLVDLKTDYPMLGRDIFSREENVVNTQEAKDNSATVIRYNLFSELY